MGRQNKEAIRSIDRTEKYGDWCIYPLFLQYDNPKNAHKNTQKSSKNIKPSKQTVVSTWTNFVKSMLFFMQVILNRKLRLPGTFRGVFRGVSRPSDVARPVWTEPLYQIKAYRAGYPTKPRILK